MKRLIDMLCRRLGYVPAADKPPPLTPPRQEQPRMVDGQPVVIARLVSTDPLYADMLRRERDIRLALAARELAALQAQADVARLEGLRQTDSGGAS